MRRLARGRADYEEARRSAVWTTLKPDRYPDLIIRPDDAAEVVAAVAEAGWNGMPVAVKGAGHNYTCTYLRDGGMMLDLSGLDGIEVDGEVARVGPGARSADLFAALAAAGRAFPTGHHSGVSVGGYLLGGGMGWNGENWGQFACFNVTALDVVLASGEPVRIDAESHPDLFWAARGAGPLFCAAVTRFHLATYPLPTAVRGVRMVYPLDAAPAVSDWLARAGLERHADVEIILMYQVMPGADAPCCLVLLLYHGSDAAVGEAALAAIAAAAPAGAAEAAGPFPLTYDALYADSLTGEARRTGADTIWTDDGAAASAVLAERMREARSPGTVGIVNFRGEPALRADAACSMAGTAFLQWIGQWTDPAADAVNFAWVEDTAAALGPMTRGCYVNETDILRRPERTPRCFSEAAWRRLAEVRERYDPERRFPPP